MSYFGSLQSSLSSQSYPIIKMFTDISPLVLHNELYSCKVFKNIYFLTITSYCISGYKYVCNKIVKMYGEDRKTKIFPYLNQD